MSAAHFAASTFVALFVLAAAACAADAADALSPAAMNQRIQKRRTADVTLIVTDAAGQALANTAVTVRMERHQFLFGCNAFAVNPANTAAEQTAYQERYAALLNYATLPFYWGGFEPTEGQPGTARVRAMAQWCADQHLRIKGHPLCWHEVPAKWLDPKPLDEVQSLQLGRITREVTAFAGLIDTWDVVNEAVAMPNYQVDKNRIAQLARKLGTVELIKQTFAAARAANPKATLILNDYNTSPQYETLVKNCLAAGVTIDVIGIQSHQHTAYWGAAKTWDVCERFAKFGKPLHFTETTLQSGEMKKNLNYQGRYDDWASTPEGEARQLQQVTEFYRVLFSHPAVEGITWWDLSDRGAWLGAPAGLIRKDMSPKPAYEALLKMVKQEWWTPVQQLTTDAQGRVKFHGFLGTYAVETGKGKASVTVTTPGAANVAVQMAFRMTIDDVFALKTPGSVVVVGVVACGEVRPGATLVVAGSERLQVRVRALEAYNKPLERAGAGDRVGIMLDGISKSQVKPGDSLTAVGDQAVAGRP